MTGDLAVTVAGAGIGGLAAATALARAGHRVTVLERSPAPDAVQGAGLLLYANGVAAADAVDPALGARLRERGHVVGPGEVRTVVDAAGTVLAVEPVGDAGVRAGYPQVPILRAELHAALRDRAAAAGVRVRYGVTVRGCRDAGDGVDVLLDGGGQTRADLLVGADGLRSAVRAALLGDGPPQYRGYTSVRGHTVGAALYPRSVVANGRGVQLFTAPVGGGGTYWTAKITAAAGTWPAYGPAAAHRRLLELMHGWQPELVQLVRDADPDRLTVTDIHDRDPVRRWVRGRAVLLGDAAHPMVPALGQGANTALEDAVALAAALRTHADAGSGLRAYERVRTARTAPIVRQSRRQGAVDQGAGRLGALRRDLLTRLRGRKDLPMSAIVGWRPAAAVALGAPDPQEHP